MQNQDSLLKSITKPSKIGAVVSYLIIFFLGSSFIVMALAFITAIQYDVSYAGVISYIGLISTDEIYYLPAIKANTWGNFISYGITFVFVVFYMRNYLKEDALKIKEKPLKIVLFLVLGTAAFYGITYLIEYLISKAIGDMTSENQNIIISMIKDGSGFATFFSVVVFAPLVEELIYRKVIFEACKKKSIILAYVLSVFVFSLPHMISTTDVSFGTWCILLISYASSGFLLSGLYHISGENIYVSTFAHIVNNFVGFCLIATILF